MPAPGRSRILVALSAGVALAVGLAAPAVAASPPAAPPRAVAASTAAVTYETWLADVRVVTDQAQAYVARRIPQSPASRQAIVLDIDNTALASHFNPWTYPVPAVPSLLALAKYASARGVKIFFVTGRPDLIDVLTLDNLKVTGYPNAGLYSRDLLELLQPLDVVKTAARQQIERNGYTIIANIGNNTTDLAGGHAERTFKLPDYDGLLD